MPNETTAQDVERQIPGIAQKAFQRAFKESLAAGNVVTVRRSANIIEVRPDGTEQFVKRARPLVRVRRGAKIKLT